MSRFWSVVLVALLGAAVGTGAALASGPRDDGRRPPKAAAPVATATTLPAGPFYTVVLRSYEDTPAGRAEAQAAVRDAAGKGMPDPFVASRGDYPQIREGWVGLLSGRFATLREASQHARQARQAGYSIAYPKPEPLVRAG